MILADHYIITKLIYKKQLLQLKHIKHILLNTLKTQIICQIIKTYRQTIDDKAFS